MKPTQEQVIKWAGEAGWMNVLWKDQYAEAMECMKKGFALAYAQGRKDENEACAKMAENRWLDKANCTAEEMYEMQKKSIADAIRARIEQ